MKQQYNGSMLDFMVQMENELFEKDLKLNIQKMKIMGNAALRFLQG